MDEAKAAATAVLINEGVRLLSTTRGLLTAAKRRARLARLQRFATPKALQRAIARRDVGLGATVRVDGYASRYAHLFRPISYLNVQLDSERMVSMAARHGIRGIGLVMANRAAQNPISTIPRFAMNGGDVRCLFLYPRSHDRFLYSRPVDKKDLLNTLRLPDVYGPRVAVPDDAYPIPLLLPADDAMNVAERAVSLTAVVRELPADLAERFRRLYAAHFDSRVLSNFLFIPGEPPISICLSVLPEDEDTGFETKQGVQAADRGVLYIEGHVDGSDDVSISAIAQALPLDERLEHLAQLRLLGDGSAVLPTRVKGAGPLSETEGEVFRVLAAQNDVTVNLKAPNIVGFYAETTPREGLSARVSALQAMIAAFRTQLTRVPVSAPEPMSFVLDFLFDFDRQALFDEGGVLASETALSALRGDVELHETRDWLRGAGT